MPPPVTLRRARQLLDRQGEAHGQAPLSWSRTAPPTARLVFSRLRLPLTERPDLPAEWPAGHCLHVRDLRREGPLSQTKTKARGARGAHALPRRSAPARPETFSKFTCIPGRQGVRRGPELPAAGRRARCGAQAVTGRRSGAGLGHNGSRRVGGRADGRASAGTARARPLRGRSSSAAGAPNAAATAGHRRAARPVHANGRRPRHELFSSGAERASAARRAARPACPPPLRSRRGDFPNFPRSAPRMRPPRRLRPRPSAPAALPPLPPILCLLSRSWHLSQRARFPAHPFAAGSGRGRGYGGPGEEGTGRRGSKAPTAPQSGETARGRRPRRAPGRPCSAGRSGLLLCPEYQQGLPGPPAVPAAGEDRARPLLDSPPPRASAAHPPPGAGARGRGGRREQRIRRPGPAPRPAAPRARPRGHAAPGAPPPARSRQLARAGQGAPRRGDSSAFCFAPCSPHGPAPAPARPRRPGTEAAAGARSAAALRGAGCHDCGQRGARAHARARLGDPGRSDGPWPDRSPVCAADCGQIARLCPAKLVVAVEL